MIKAVDVLGKGKLSFEDYAAAILDWKEITKDKRYYHLCRQVFEGFDADKDGFIGVSDLHEELPMGTEAFTDKEVKVSLRPRQSLSTSIYIHFQCTSILPSDL